jgi:DNA-binding NarL/FixJ family response regulator
MTASPTRVLVVDDDPLVRAGLRLMFGGADDIVFAGEASDGDEVLAAVEEFRPDVVLLDIRMARVDGITALRMLRDSAARDLPVIVLTTFRTDAVVLDALRAGAVGFLLKHTPPAEIVGAIRLAAAGQSTLSPDVLAQLVAQAGAEGALPDANAAAGRLAALTEREREVAFAVADGLGNAEIAQRLFLSHGSVKAHLSSALTKLGLDNRIQLAILAHDAREG